MSTNQFPANVLVTLDELLALRFQAAGTLNKSYKKSSAMLAGGFSSPFRGRGIDFSEVRLYEPGDDVRSIDWRVTARTGKPHTKLFVEERERPVLFVLDCGSNMQFGTKGAFKSVIAAKTMALLAWIAAKHGDRVGGLIFTAAEHLEIKPVGGKRGILKFFKQAIDWNQKQLIQQTLSGDSNFKDVIFRLRRIARPGSLVYFISDFSGLDHSDLGFLSQVAAHCELTLIHIFDVLEKQAPPAGMYQISNGQDVNVISVDERDFPARIKQQFNQRLALLDMFRRQHGVHFFSVSTMDDVKQVVRDNLTHKMLNAI